MQDAQDEANRIGHSTPLAIFEEVGPRERLGATLGLEGTATSRQNVADPVAGGPVRERDDIPASSREDVDRGAKQTLALAPGVHHNPESRHTGGQSKRNAVGHAAIDASQSTGSHHE